MPDTPHPALSPLGVADLQVHTDAGDGLPSAEAILRWAETHTDLDVIAVTDHDDLRGALRAREAAERLGSRIEVIVGMEITTRGGHLLALFLERPAPSLRTLADTIAAVHDQGGICIVPHPLSRLTPSLGRRAIDAAAASLDGIELANPTPAARWRQHHARRLNALRWNLPETGGSDAHFLQAVGSAVTRFPGHGAADLRAALAAGLTTAEARAAPGLRTIGLRDLARQQWRGLGATPRAVGRQWRLALHQHAHEWRSTVHK